MSKVIDISKGENSSLHKIRKCIRTKVVYVKQIDAKRLSALTAMGFTVILKG